MAFTVELFPATLEEARRLFQQGRSLADITRTLEEWGHKTKSGRPVSYYILRKYLVVHPEVLDSVCSQWATRNSWEQWAERHLEPREGVKSLQKSTIYDAYLTWCRDNEQEPMSAHKVGSWLRKRYEWKNRDGHIVYLGVAIRDP